MSEDTDYLIIGGGLAGAIAAETIRNEGKGGRITIISAEKFPPYHRPPLTKDFLLGKRKKKQLVVLEDKYYRENEINLILDTRATAVDPENKRVNTDNSGEFHFEKLLLATGCSPVKLDVPGADLGNIHYLRTISDSETLKREIEETRRAVVVGGSFIAMELASAFVKSGLEVALINRESIVFDKLFSPEVSDFFVSYYRGRGVEIVLGDPVKEFRGKNEVNEVVTDSGEIFSCDFVAVGVGVLPDVDFLQGSGIEVDDGVVVDEYLQTNKPDIYAAGDVANFFDPVFTRYRRIEHWDNAIKQGRTAATNMIGGKEPHCVVSYFFSDVFDLSFNFFGDPVDTDERIVRGSFKHKSFSILYLKDNKLCAAFLLGRPTIETRMAESIIHNRVDLKHVKNKLPNTEYPLEKCSSQTTFILQGGGALGAFSAGAVRAMEEKGIYPDIVAGVSIGAFNAAIIASNPKNSAPALEAFWRELAINTPKAANEYMRRLLSSLQILIFGASKFFRPRWFKPVLSLGDLPINWKSFYDPTPVKELLSEYVDFVSLRESPIRLLVSAVNVETAEFRTFDSYREEITPDHLLASGSLPPGFPWTTIDGEHYWDGGIISNTPLKPVMELCGTTVKSVYIVELYPKNKPLPQNMMEIIERRDEIFYSDKTRSDIRGRELINDYKKLVEEIMGHVDPQEVNRIKQRPLYIQTMGDPGLLSITKITHEGEKGELPSKDYDFSIKSIEDHIHEGYKVAKEILDKG